MTPERLAQIKKENALTKVQVGELADSPSSLGYCDMDAVARSVRRSTEMKNIIDELVAEVERVSSIGLLGLLRMGMAKQDGEWFVFLEFEDFDSRANFSELIPNGEVYANTRNNRGFPYRLTWKLSDYEIGFVINLKQAARPEVSDGTN